MTDADTTVVLDTWVIIRSWWPPDPSMCIIWCPTNKDVTRRPPWIRWFPRQRASTTRELVRLEPVRAVMSNGGRRGYLLGSFVGLRWATLSTCTFVAVVEQRADVPGARKLSRSDLPASAITPSGRLIRRPTSTWPRGSSSTTWSHRQRGRPPF